MLITAITQQKRDPSRYNIFIDGVYAFALPMQDILYFKLKEGQEAAEEESELLSGPGRAAADYFSASLCSAPSVCSALSV